MRFTFNCYKHWVQLRLRQPGSPPVTLLFQEGVTQEDPLLIILYRVNLVPLEYYLRSVDPGLITPFYAYYVLFEGLARRISPILKLFLDRGPDRRYLPEPSKSMFISDSPNKEEAENQKFNSEGLNINFVG